MNSAGGIILDSSRSNNLVDNICSANDDFGMYLVNSGENNLVHNTCVASYQYGHGIYLYYSEGNNMMDNICSDDSSGILLVFSNGNELRNNTCVGNYVGIDLFWSVGNSLIKNNCSSGDGCGIYLIDHSVGNTLIENTCSNNSQYGVFIADVYCSDNRVWNNSLMFNNGAGDYYDPAHIQAYDDGTGNWWNSTDGFGNYWSDWTTPDIDMNGIVDDPYLLDGSAGAKDNYPLTTTPLEPIPEFGIMPFFVIVLLVVIVLAMETRRKNAWRP